MTRPLTSEEQAIAESIFGNSIDYSKTSITNGPYTLLWVIPAQKAGTVMVPNGHIYYNKSKQYHDNIANANLRNSGDTHLIHQ